MAPVAMIMTMCTMPAQSVGVAAFNQSLRDDLQISASQLAGTYALGTVIASLLLPFAGAAIDRFGLRRTLLGIIPGLCGACCFISTVRGVIPLFFAFLMLRLFGQGTLSLCAQNTLAMWFRNKLGRVAGITSTFVTFFMASAPLLLRVAIDRFGWRTTYRGLGLAIVVALLPLLTVYENKPEGRWSVAGWRAPGRCGRKFGFIVHRGPDRTGGIAAIQLLDLDFPSLRFGVSSGLRSSLMFSPWDNRCSARIRWSAAGEPFRLTLRTPASSSRPES